MTDSITTLPNETGKRRDHPSIPDRGDDWVLRGLQFVPDWDASTLKVTHGKLVIAHSDTLYWSNAGTRTGLSIPSGSSDVYYSVDTSGSRPTGSISIGSTPSEPRLKIGTVDADAETTDDTLNRDPDESFGKTVTDEVANKSQPASYHVKTDGTTIYGIPQENEKHSNSLSRVTDTDIGSFLYELIVNQLPVQGEEKEATGAIWFKAGEYPGKLSNATGGAVPIGSQLQLIGESVSHYDGSGISTIPTSQPGVRFLSDGDGFRNPNNDSDNIIYPVIKNIQISGAGSSTGTGIDGTGSNLLDWIELDTVVIDKFNDPINLSSSTGHFTFWNCQFRQFDGRLDLAERVWGYGSAINVGDGDVRISGARLNNCKLQGSGSSRAVYMNNGGSLVQCRVAKVGDTTSGDGIQVTSTEPVHLLNVEFDQAEGSTGAFSNCVVMKTADCTESRLMDVRDTFSGASNSLFVNGTDVSAPIYVIGCELPNGIGDSGNTTIVDGEILVEGTADTGPSATGFGPVNINYTDTDDGNGTGVYYEDRSGTVHGPL